MNKIYFDNAATTKMDSSVIEVMNSVMIENYGNPSSTHSFGRASRTIVEKARKSIANEFNVTPNEIFFTSGGTEGDNTILVSAVKDLGVKTIITSKIEHKAVLNVVKLLEKTSSVNVVYVKLSENGIIDYNDLEKILNYDDTKKLISLMHVNNEIGTLLDLKKVSNLCEKYDAFFHSDTVQTIGKYKIDLSEINIDFIVGSAHKFHGPKGIGFTYVNKKNKLMPLVVGGSQERGMRAGTEAVHNISGMEKAFLLSYLNLQNNKKHVIELKTYFINQIKEKLPNIKFNGNCDSNDSSTYTILNLCLPVPKEKSVLLEFNLDLKGIACSRGSACQSGSSQGSHVLNNILSKDDLNKPSIRFSFSQFNKKEEIDIVVEVLKTFIRSN